MKLEPVTTGAFKRGSVEAQFAKEVQAEACTPLCIQLQEIAATVEAGGEAAICP